MSLLTCFSAGLTIKRYRSIAIKTIEYEEKDTLTAGQVRTSLHKSQVCVPNGHFLHRIPTRVIGMVITQSAKSEAANAAMKMFLGVLIPEKNCLRCICLTPTKSSIGSWVDACFSDKNLFSRRLFETYDLKHLGPYCCWTLQSTYYVQCTEDHLVTPLTHWAYFDSKLHTTQLRPTKKAPSESPDHGLSEYTLTPDFSLNTASPDAVFQKW